MQGKVKPLSPNNLRLVCDPASLSFETTADLEPTTAIIGQPRATKALEFGMGLKSKGYNIFVTGSTGTGRSTVIRHFLQERCGRETTPDDLLYLYNFEAAHRPQAISLPPGQGSKFAEHMKQLIEAVQLSLTQAFESSSYREAIHALEQQLVEQREEKLDALDRRATEQGFDLQDSPAGLVILVAGEEEAGDPIVNGELQARRETQRGLQMELQGILREVRIVERDAREERRQLDKQVAEAAVQDEFDTLREKYTEQSVISDYLDAVREDVVDQVTRAASALDDKDLDQVVDLRRYEVNVLVNNADGKGAPVIVQLNPTYENLFGRLEYETQGHAMTTHFTQIRAGDLHRANGGYLVMYALDLIRQRETWEALKRALKAQEIEMRSPSSDAPAIANSLWPQPIPLNSKIILLGHSNLYESLYWNDEEFIGLFKVRADFSDSMPRDPANELSYAEFVASRSQEEKLRPFGRDAVAKIIEHGARLAENQCKLSTRFGAIADLARESNYWAGIDGHDVVTADDVRNAFNERTHRASQEAEQVREEILEGMIFIATEGEIVGQVNGLSVREVGDFSFGHPGCISARTFMGESGVVHIERETEMDGPIHEKGVLTLNGYLGGTYAQHQPLSLSASLTFEQTYGGIDGDSASSSELYALISSLSGFPARQGISVTGSVNQHGEIQPIGAVNEKIEGFFDVCQARGLTGNQGVLIPATNSINLMLREDVVETVGKGLFHIWPVSNIDEGIELLMGRPAGEPDQEGEYAEGTVHHAVKKRLMELAMELKSFGDDHSHDQADEEN